MAAPLTLQEVYTDAGQASDEMYAGYNPPFGRPAYAVPPAVMAEIAKFESGLVPDYVSEDGKHYGLGAIGLPSDSAEAAAYQLDTDTPVDLAYLDDPKNNLRVMAYGLEMRVQAQKGTKYEGDYLAAAAAYAGDAYTDDGNGHKAGEFNPDASDPYTKITGQDYYNAIKKGIETDYPGEAAAVEKGYTDTSSGKNPDTSLLGGLKTILGIGGIGGEIATVALYAAFFVGGLAVVIALGMVTSKALSSGGNDAGEGGGHPIVKTAAKAAVLA